MHTTLTRRRAEIVRVVLFVARVIAVGTLVVLATMISSVLQSIPAAQRSSDARTVQLRVAEPPTARGNCPDAQVVAQRVADLATVVGHSSVTFRLSPVAGCAPDADAYRARVRVATLWVSFASGDWAAVGPDIRRQLVAALTHSLRRFYPVARTDVIVRAGVRVVRHAGAAP